MISKDHRFHGLGSLRFVFKAGQTVRDKHCALRYGLNNRRKTYRFTVVISRKVHKSAVARNRIRRRLYEEFRQMQLDINAPYDFVLTVYSPELIEAPSKDLEKMLRSLFVQALQNDRKN